MEVDLDPFRLRDHLLGKRYNTASPSLFDRVERKVRFFQSYGPSTPRGSVVGRGSAGEEEVPGSPLELADFLNQWRGSTRKDLGRWLRLHKVTAHEFLLGDKETGRVGLLAVVERRVGQMLDPDYPPESDRRACRELDDYLVGWTGEDCSHDFIPAAPDDEFFWYYKCSLCSLGHGRAPVEVSKSEPEVREAIEPSCEYCGKLIKRSFKGGLTRRTCNEVCRQALTRLRRQMSQSTSLGEEICHAQGARRGA